MTVCNYTTEIYMLHVTNSCSYKRHSTLIFSRKSIYPKYYIIIKANINLFRTNDALLDVVKDITLDAQNSIIIPAKIMSDGSYRDTVIFSIIESEWKACKHSLNYKIEQNHKKTYR